MLTRLFYRWHIPVPKFVQRFAHIVIKTRPYTEDMGNGPVLVARSWSPDWPAYEKELGDNHLRHYLREKAKGRVRE